MLSLSPSLDTKLLYFQQYNSPSHSIDFFVSQMIVTCSTNQEPRWPYKNHDIDFHILLFIVL